jgi:hypothetical protein
VRAPPRLKPQHGLALIFVISVLALAAILVLLGSLNAASLRVERDRTTREALIKAKEALIAYAVSDPNRPGELPCPDINDDGLVTGEDLIVSACASYTGRLPWVTLGIPDLRDDSGERLWYALSVDFHANGAVGAVALNSDTAFRTGNTSLTISGTQQAANVVAVVFSAGSPLQRADGVFQARGCTVGVNCDATRKCTTSPASNTPKCNPINYLDVSGGIDNADLDNNFVSAGESASFNDRVLAIYSDDIMSLVQKRAGMTFAQNLRSHYDNWQSAALVTGAKGFYPWAAPLTDPSVVQPGSNGTTNGLLPLSASAVVWDPASVTVTLGTCSVVGTTQLVCTIPIALLGTTITARVRNVGTAFVDPPQASDVAVSGIVLLSSYTWTLNPALQTLDFSYNATLALAATVTVNAPSASAWTTSTWLAKNNWHQAAYYAVAPAFAINGSGSCGACVTINNTAMPNNNKQAVVMMTGRALSGQRARPVMPLPALPGDYLEGANLTPSTLVFEHKLRSNTFNDEPIAVRPWP